MSLSALAQVGLAKVANSLLQGVLAKPLSLGASDTSKSQFAEILREVASKKNNASSSSAISSSDDRKAEAWAELTALSAQLGNLFSEYGIDTSAEIVLTTDGQGGITVANAHPDKARIEALFERHPEYGHKLSAISSELSTVSSTATVQTPYVSISGDKRKVYLASA